MTCDRRTPARAASHWILSLSVLLIIGVSGSGCASGGDEAGRAGGTPVIITVDASQYGAAGTGHCEPNPCLDLGIEGKTTCIPGGMTGYVCKCDAFHEDDGNGGCALREEPLSECPSTPTGMATLCIDFVDQETGEPSGDRACVFSGAIEGDPSRLPKEAGKLWAACTNEGDILPACGSGAACGGPIEVSEQYRAELNKLYSVQSCTDPPEGDGLPVCDTKILGEWVGMCFPRCDACANKSCPAAGQCVQSTCSGLTGECGEDKGSYDGKKCDDGNECTSADACRAGECLSQVSEPAGKSCTLEGGEPGVCDGAGSCAAE